MPTMIRRPTILCRSIDLISQWRQGPDEIRLSRPVAGESDHDSQRLSFIQLLSPSALHRSKTPIKYFCKHDCAPPFLMRSVRLHPSMRARERIVAKVSSTRIVCLSTPSKNNKVDKDCVGPCW